MVARSANGERTALLVADYGGLSGNVVLDVKGLPRGKPHARVIDHSSDLEPVGMQVDGTRIRLPKSGRDAASYLVTWEK